MSDETPSGGVGESATSALCGDAVYLAIPETLNLAGVSSCPWTPRHRAVILEGMSAEQSPVGSRAKVVDLRVARALRAVEADPARHWRVRELAKLAGASRASFARLFRAATGTSPKRWLTARRLERAAMLLVTTESTLAEIARHVGYVSEFALSRAFKRHHGVAPALYRQASSPIRCAA